MKDDHTIAYENRTIRHALSILEGRLRFPKEELLDMDHAKDFAKFKLSLLEHEEFGCMFLSSASKFIEYYRAAIGTLGECPVYPREIVKASLRANAVYAILMHNHPCGSLYASSADIALTHKLQKCLALVDVVVWDHLVIAGKEVYSMLDSGQMLPYPVEPN